MEFIKTDKDISEHKIEALLIGGLNNIQNSISLWQLTDYLHQSTELKSNETQGRFERNINSSLIYQLPPFVYGAREFVSSNPLVFCAYKYIQKSIPIVFKDEIMPRIKIKKIEKLNPELKNSPNSQSGKVEIPIEFNFNEVIEITHWYTFLDIFSRLGGLFIFIKLVFFFLVMPFVILSFLHRMALLIKTKYGCSFRESLNDIAKRSFTQLLKIQELQNSSPS